MAPSQWDNYTPDPTPDPEERHGGDRPRPRSARSTPSRPAARRRTTSPVGVAIAVVAVLSVLGVVTLIAVLGNEDDPDLLGVDTAEADREEVAAQASEGFGELLDDLRDEVGHTTVREVVIYPGYAVVDVPYDADDPTDEREISLYWDGSLRETTKGTSDYADFDLADVDSSRFVDMCAEARAQIEDPESCYLIIRRPEPDGDGGWISAYSSNEFSQGGYVEYDLEGNEVQRQTW